MSFLCNLLLVLMRLVTPQRLLSMRMEAVCLFLSLGIGRGFRRCKAVLGKELDLFRGPEGDLGAGEWEAKRLWCETRLQR